MAKKTNPDTASTILVVDDHPIMREGIAQVINAEADLTVCGEAEDAESALAAIEKSMPDLVIIDISLSTKCISGLDLIKDIRIRYETLPVLVLSMHDESFYAERALRAGAQGYIMKHEPSEKCLTAIRRVLQGKVYVSDKMTERVLQTFGTQASGGGSPVDSLSKRELEVFRLIAEGYKTRPIAEQLHVSARTVESYCARIKEKLNLKNAAELAQHAIQWGRIQLTGAPDT